VTHVCGCCDSCAHPDTLQAELDDSDEDSIPSSILLETPNSPSALQVFSSVGGLALLAEHLPLLYPEFNGAVLPPMEVTRDVVVSATTGLGHDWVAVESAEEIYEVNLDFIVACWKNVHDSMMLS